jgi:hypothetical protein
MQQVEYRIETTTGQTDMLWEILSTADDAWFVPHRQAHGLGLVELGILEGGETDQTVGQRLWQLRFGDKNLVGQHKGQRFW